jgi:hypothetical protein
VPTKAYTPVRETGTPMAISCAETVETAVASATMVSAKGSFMACLVIEFWKSNEFVVFQSKWLPYIGVSLEKIGHQC